MRKLVLASVVVGSIMALACGGATSTDVAQAQKAADQPVAHETAEGDVQPAALQETEARHDVVYVCSCGPDCTCKSAATQAGKCSCGKDLAWAHVVKVEGDEALLCTCAEGCTCTVSPDDPTKCACGHELRRVSFAGTGLYYCNCGGSCTCNYVSSEPGTCTCGMELKKSA